MIELVAALALAGDPSVRPWPIGPGAAYRPSAGPTVQDSVCPNGGAFRVHVELFAERNAVVVPAGIGACSDPVRTRTPTGVFEVSSRGRPTVGDLFRVWGQPLSTHRLASFTSGSPVRVYVNGRPVGGPVGSIPLTKDAEIVLEIGGYVPPHRFFLFPKGSP